MRRGLVIAAVAVLVWATLFSPAGACPNGDCGSTCLDVCQSMGADLVEGCSCSFGCGCLCSPGAGAATCEDFGCTSDPY
jgi:hypothetical protein